MKHKRALALLLALALSAGILLPAAAESEESQTEETLSEQAADEETAAKSVTTVEVLSDDSGDETAETDDADSEEETQENASEEAASDTDTSEGTTTDHAEEIAEILFDEDGNFDYELEFDTADFEVVGTASIAADGHYIGSTYIPSELEYQETILAEMGVLSLSNTGSGYTVKTLASTGMNADLSLLSTASGTTTITRGNKVTYDSWSTSIYTAGDYVAFCGNSSKSPTSGSMTTYLYTAEDSYSSTASYTEDETVYNLLKAVMLVSPGGAFYNDYASTIFGGSCGKTISGYNSRYAYAHAIVSYLYSGSTSGVKTATKTWMNNVLDYLYEQITTEGSELAEALETTDLYVAYKSSSYQPFLWVVYEAPTPGYLKITKSSANTASYSWGSQYTCSGAIYGVYKSGSTSSNTVDTETRVTTITCTVSNGDGSYSSTAVELEPGTYYIQEIYAPHGYKLDTTVYKVTVTAGSTTSASTVSATNWPMKFPILVTKTDAVTGEALEGAVFTLYSDSACTQVVDTQVTGTNSEYGDGVALFTDLPIGTYYLKETAAPDGYELDETVYEITCTEETGLVSNFTLKNGSTTYGTLNVVLNCQGRFVSYLSSPTTALKSLLSDENYDLIMYTYAVSDSGETTETIGYSCTAYGSYYFFYANINELLGFDEDGTYYFTWVLEKTNKSGTTITGYTNTTLASVSVHLEDVSENLQYTFMITQSKTDYQSPDWDLITDEVEFKPTLTITKTDIALDTALSNAVFAADYKITLTDSLNQSKSVTSWTAASASNGGKTDSGGTVTFTGETITLQAGTYYYCTNYDMLSDSGKAEVDSIVSSGGTIEVDGTEYEVSAGYAFQNEEDAQAALAEDPVLTGELSVTVDWRYSETSAPDDYILLSDTVSLSSGVSAISTAENTIDDFYNALEPTPTDRDYTQTIEICKRSPLFLPGETIQYIEGIEFTLTWEDRDGEYTETLVTDENGCVSYTAAFTTETYYYLDWYEEYAAKLASDPDDEALAVVAAWIEAWQAEDPTHHLLTEEAADDAMQAEIDAATYAYTLTETGTVYGWAALEDTITFTITGEEGSLDGTDTNTILYNGQTVTIINKPNRGSINITKTDDDGAALPGVTYQLYTTLTSDPDGVMTIDTNTYVDYNGTRFYLVDETVTDSGGEVIWTDLYADGETEYLVIESETVDGYTLLAEPICVGILPMELSTSPNASYEGTAWYDDDLSCYRYCDVYYTVSDGASFDIPMAGGTGFSGNAGFMAGAIALAAALSVLYLLYRKGSQENKYDNLPELPGYGGI